MKKIFNILLCVVVILIAAGCATTKGKDKKTASPEPPKGYTWANFPKAKILTLQPKNWFVEEFSHQGIYVGTISKESIKEKGSFQTGFTVQYLTGIKAKTGNPPSAACLNISKKLANDKTNELLKIVPLNQDTDFATHLIFYRNIEVKDQPVMIYKYFIANDKLDILYMVTFQAPEVTWEKDWEHGEQIMRNLKIYGEKQE